MKKSDSQPADISFKKLPKALKNAAKRANWTDLMPVQARTIPYLLGGKNLMVQARTGSGKTGAFLLPMLEHLEEKKNHCQALILVPTRELARQIVQEANILFGDKDLRTVAVYGGVGYKAQINAFQQGAQIVVGTPGRVLDHLLKKNLSLKDLSILVFDEADRMLSMGFYPDMKKLQTYLPKHKLHKCMFSATFPSQVQYTANEFIENPEFISLSTDQVHVADTDHVFYTIPGMGKDRCLMRIIEVENPASAIIFCNTKAEVHYVCTVLQQFGYDADEITSDLPQSKREQVLARVHKGSLRFLVATDVAARGIDIPDLSHVFQYDVPEDFEAYIHRSGRTGRAGAAGVAITLVSHLESLTLKRIAKRYSIDFEERPLPKDEDVEVIVSERITALLEARLRDRDVLKTERSKRFVKLAKELAESEDESTIIAMLLDDYYQEILHAPAIVPGPKSQESDKKPGKKKKRRRFSRGRSAKQT